VQHQTHLAGSITLDSVACLLFACMLTISAWIALQTVALLMCSLQVCMFMASAPQFSRPRRRANKTPC
jgi:hypothetical protein